MIENHLWSESGTLRAGRIASSSSEQNLLSLPTASLEASISQSLQSGRWDFPHQKQGVEAKWINIREILPPRDICPGTQQHVSISVEGYLLAYSSLHGQHWLLSTSHTPYTRACPLLGPMHLLQIPLSSSPDGVILFLWPLSNPGKARCGWRKS